MPEKKRVALVTGGSRGIGRGICLALAQDGFAVVVNYNSNSDAALHTKHMIEQMGGTAEICQADITTVEHRELLVDHCMETFGRLDVLVNNAGIAPPERRDLLEMTEASYDLVMATNLRAPFFLAQRVARLMIEQRKNRSIPAASIINVSSVSAYAASINRGEYCISKAGLSMITTLLAVRLAEEGINVYEIRPGIIATDMTAGVKEKYDRLIREGFTPIRRWGQPADVGKAVAMLARGDLPFSTGEVINVDGGYALRYF
ncbi:MAG: 3-ketoacyl-ACP reductase [Phycisphaerae bacterium]|nr:3-ketoacyl-ACP reductase [Phycisphaerae bacterium]